MSKQYESLGDLKRSVYLWVIPCILIALILNTIIQNVDASDKLSFIINNTMTIWFAVSWVLVYKKRFVRFSELSNLALVSVYHVTTFFDTIYNYMLKINGSLGDFIVWMPIIIMFIFLTLGIRRGLYYSIGIFLITLLGGVVVINKLSAESIDSLMQFYFANVVYIIVLFYAQHMFRAYAKMELFKKHAYLDSLTGIANRHQIDEWLEQKLSDSREMHMSFSIIFFDIDYFKKVNDLFGHKIGDSVLVELAELIKENLSPRDLLGRWGGEEFIVISDVLGHNAVALADYLREKVEEHEFQGVGRLTASFGVAESELEDNIDSLLNRADEGLYQSKNTGKNKVSICNYV
ncbi:GGDEF domain-containing protein [Neobacillus sp. PS2-9]|uniref:GGDEF domain-containing protein n=1 Tax=Neobacillus sp. PS2-9 TaxID=3070676 RepID=UPI0027E01901|nr:GGDEF domain-containing protein [Neobacillus sp. PS2-9]WML57661.1 GGDEF domain-containing protein [Neobacillus sp. PS2-9]